MSPNDRAASVNMALSLSLSGQADRSVAMLRGPGSRPDATPRVRQDLAVALALSGNTAGGGKTAAHGSFTRRCRGSAGGLSGARHNRQMTEADMEYGNLVDPRETTPTVRPVARKTRQHRAGWRCGHCHAGRPWRRSRWILAPPISPKWPISARPTARPMPARWPTTPAAPTTTMNSAVSNLATLNGLPAGAAVAGLVPSPSGDGNSAVKVTVTTATPLFLAKVIQSSSTLSVSATSYAEVKPNASACIIALNAGGSGVTLSGGTAVTASSCTVASDATVTVPCGTSITTKSLDYNSAAVPSQPCSGIKPPAGTASVNIVKTVTADPLSGNTAVSGDVHPPGQRGEPDRAIRANVVAAGSNFTFTWGSPAVGALAGTGGCTGAFADSTWTVTCPAGGTYHFGTIQLGGGITLDFAVGGSSTNIYDFSGAIDVNGSAASFGPGTYNVAGGIITGGGTTTTFGAGNYHDRRGHCRMLRFVLQHLQHRHVADLRCRQLHHRGRHLQRRRLDIEHRRRQQRQQLQYRPWQRRLRHQYRRRHHGHSGQHDDGTFQAVGNISTGGGSTFTLSAAPAHDLNGAFSLAGSATLGAGTYTVAGNFALGAGGGGGNVTGSGVSIITSGTFSVAAGYSNVTLTAPASGTQQGLVVASNGVGGASFSEGASGNSLSGVFYFPSAPITLSGAGSVGNGAGQCLGADRLDDQPVRRFGPGVHLRRTGRHFQRRSGGAGAMISQRRRRRGSLFRRRDGTAAVEMALISPMLMILLAGIIDFGRAYQEEIELSSAVAAASQYALLNVANINSTSAASLASQPQRHRCQHQRRRLGRGDRDGQ